MYCKNCGTEIPTGVSFCPKCKKDVYEKNDNGFNKLLLIVLLISAFAFILFVSLVLNYEDDEYEIQNQSSQGIESTKQTEKDIWLYEGMYKVGADIPAGEYKVTCTAGSSCYIEVNCSSDGEFESIVSNDHIDTFSYIAVTEGQYLTVNRGEFSLVE